MQTLKYLSYLPIIRWGSLISFLIITFGMDYFLPNHQTPKASIFIVAFHIISNIGLHLTYKKIRPEHVTRFAFVTFVLDLALLTVLISQNGGAHNPFSSLFLVFAGLSALLLSRNYLLLFIVTCLACLAVIYGGFLQTNTPFHMGHSSDFDLHLRGMWLANSLGVVLVCSWIYYMKQLNTRMHQKTESTQKILSHIEQVESLGRVVASASHQLNTPLGTLQLGLSELNDSVNPISEPEKLRWHQDMQHAINQISNIVSKIQSNQLESSIKTDDVVDSHEFITQWVAHWSGPRNQLVTLHLENPSFEIKTQTAEALGNVISVLLDNASEASSELPLRIELSTHTKEDEFYLRVTDNGCGMSTDTQAHAFEPLFTTKNKGTGLGLYLCHQIVQKYEGEITIDSVQAKGTQITIKLQKHLL